MTEKQFRPYSLGNNKTVKDWINWLSQFDDDCKVKTILVKGENCYIHLNSWTTGLRLFFEVEE